MQRQYRAISRIHAAPRLVILVLFVTDLDSKFQMREVLPDEFDQAAAIGAPIRIDRVALLEQVTRKVQRRPCGSIGGCVMVFEELREQLPSCGSAGNLMTLDPVPQRCAL